MVLKDLAIAGLLAFMALGPAASTAQTANLPSSNASAPTPAASPVSAPGAANPAPQTNCQGGPCDAPPPHITIATPAPAPAPWPLQERISWAANLILVFIAYMGVMLGLSALRKIERQTRFGEIAAQAAADSAKAALMYAEAQAQSQRPWLVVTAEAEPGPNNRFTVVATNRGRSPTKLVTLVDEIAIARDESHLPLAPVFKSAPEPPRVPIILLPGESKGLKTFSREDVSSVCETPEELRRLEVWETRIYLYGEVNYVDLRAPAGNEPYTTGWCCWYIHGQQKSGLVIAGPTEYNRHT